MSSLDTVYCEKELNLEILLLLRDTLASRYSYADTSDVFYLRYFDTTLSLQRRARVADSVNAESFISIHHNSLGPTIQRTETFFCKMFQTPEGDTWEEGAFRNIDTTLAAMLALRLNDELGFGFGWQPARENCYIVLKQTAMVSALTEAYSITDTSVADAMILNDGHIREKEASALAKGWYAHYEGVQGSGIVEYAYNAPHFLDITKCHIQIGLGNDPMLQNIPYMGCWLLNEYIMLYAEDVDAQIENTRTFQHWEWRDCKADTIIHRYSNDQREVAFFVWPFWADSVHYYRAYFTGGPFQLTLIFPQSTKTKICSDSLCHIFWGAPEGVLNSCSLYVDYSADSMQSWTNIIGPVPYNYGFTKDAAGQYYWDPPDIDACG